MRLTYWIAQCLNDSDVYSIRTRTKRECDEERAKRDGGANRFGPVKKVEIEYESGFDLLSRCLGEGRIPEEYK